MARPSRGSWAGTRLPASRFRPPGRWATWDRRTRASAGHGIANYNVALQKRTAITERFNLEFRAEMYNLFNRVQFALPDNGVTTNANPTTGQITRQINDPTTDSTCVKISVLVPFVHRRAFLPFGQVGMFLDEERRYRS